MIHNIVSIDVTCGSAVKFHQRVFNAVGDQRHSGSGGMDLVDHIATVAFPGDGAVFRQIHQGNAIILRRRADIGIVLLPGCHIHRVKIFRQQGHRKDLGIGIGRLHLVQQDAVSLAKVGGGNVCSVRIDKTPIVHRTRTHIASVKIIVVDAQVHEDHIGVDRRIFGIVLQGVVVEIDAPLQVSRWDHTSVAGLAAKYLGSSPGIVHQ